VPERFRGRHPELREKYAEAPTSRSMGAGMDLTALRKDGREIPVEISLSPMESEDGRLTISAVRDVTERRDAQRILAHQAEELEAQRAAAQDLARIAEEARFKAEAAERVIAASLREKEALLKEIHHRVKNNMQVISSLLHMQAEQLGDHTSSLAFRESEERVHAMALIHEKLYKANDLSNVDFADYVDTLASDLLHAYRTGPGRVTIRTVVTVPPLDIERAIPLGLILNELISNALKHAYPGGRSGEILVRLVVAEVGHQTLEVRDDGIGLPPDFDARKAKSLGLQIVDSLCRQLHGSHTFSTDGGSVFTMTFAEAA
jgi:two-component sensor histidine kinase